MQVKKQHLEPDMEQQTGSRLGTEYVRAVYCHLAYLTYMQSTSCEMLDWMKHRLESRLLGEISIISDMRWHHPYGRKQRGITEPLYESEIGEWKVGLKFNVQKNKFMASRPITSWQIDEETMETVTNFIFLGSKIMQMVTAAIKIRCLLLGSHKRPLRIFSNTMIQKQQFFCAQLSL